MILPIVILSSLTATSPLLLHQNFHADPAQSHRIPSNTIMGGHTLIPVFLLALYKCTHSEVQYYVTPSPVIPCPQEPCITLSQFAANSSSYGGTIPLLFLPGHHSLDEALVLSHIGHFSMESQNHEQAVVISCVTQTARITINETTIASIKGLHFVGCGGNTVTTVQELTVEDTIFQGVEGDGRGTALVLNEVKLTQIINCSFISNTPGLDSERHYVGEYITNQDLLFVNDLEEENLVSVGGALFATSSNVSVTKSKFTLNEADFGGVLFAYQSIITITHCTYSNNKANRGGVMCTVESSVDINSSKFNKNAASDNISGDLQYSGGVLYKIFGSLNVTGSTFTNNTAVSNGGVMATNDGSVNITSSTFTNNNAGNGGVMFILGGPFNIINTTFTQNSAAHGGVMASSYGLFNIINTTFTSNYGAWMGGVMYTFYGSFYVTSSTFGNNIAEQDGGVMYTSEGSFSMTTSSFTNNTAWDGGVMYTQGGSFTITTSTFTDNIAVEEGGVMDTFIGLFNIINSTFSHNNAVNYTQSGVMYISGGSFNITNTTFTNIHTDYNGIMFTQFGSFNITSTTFSSNTNTQGGLLYTYKGLFNIINSTFSNNIANNDKGVITAYYGSFNITSSTFSGNTNTEGGLLDARDGSYFNIINSTFTNNIVNNEQYGVLTAYRGLFNITSSTFSSNTNTQGDLFHASVGSYFNIINTKNIANSVTELISAFHGSINIINSTLTNNYCRSSVLFASVSSYNITSSTFTHNQAAVMVSLNGSVNIINSSFKNNTVNGYGRMMFITGCCAHMIDSTFCNNSGSLYSYHGSITFSGQTNFENSHQEGGALTSFHSTVIFNGETSLLNNQARQGGAIVAIDSRISLHGTMIIANNTATDSNGGGISLRKSVLDIKGSCTISGNSAMRGGGVHAKSSMINIHQPGTLYLMNNRAVNGSGMYLEVNPILYFIKDNIFEDNNPRNLMFSGNSANYGGAVYVADDTNYGACSPNTECFLQIIGLYQVALLPTDFKGKANIQFSGNTATEYGHNLYGGLLDRCVPSSSADVYVNQPNRTYYNGIDYLKDISNITLNSITSPPVRVCFCDSESEPDCSYQPSPIEVKKGETFKMSIVAVDQINRSVEANIISSLALSDGGFSEGQQTQSVGRNCTDLTYNVFSPHDSETLNIFADGPCGSSTPSIRHLSINFLNCSCPVGFQPSHNESTNCECVCDSRLRPYITTCDYKTNSIIRMNTNSWITYINDTDQPGYVIHPNCPYDYCQPQTVNVSIDLNLPNGADAQCAFNRTGILCGACQEHLSLSLGSSRCLPCSSYWSAVFAAIVLAAIIAGILLVIALLALNMTVAVGLINGFIFYANIVSANSAVFFPSLDPSFPTVFVAWLNLDVGIDVCFFDGLDTYTKTWLQLVFPVYIISLVVIIIKISEHSPRFVRLIGKRDPIATLATLILLSYAKLLSITITALSFAVIHYPDGSQETVWLPDGNVKYFKGKHIVLVMCSVFIILVGAPYTILLFLWQWIVRVPIRLKVFNWTRNTKLNTFMAAYHAPHNSKHRYWTGLLLLVRVVLYIISSTTVSSNPQASILTTAFFIGALTLQKSISNIKVYDKTATETIDTILCYNLLTIALFSLYHFKNDSTKQTAVAYTSTTVTFLLFIGIVVYHITVMIRMDRKRGEPETTSTGEDAMALLPQQGVTHSVVDITKEDQSPTSSEADADPTILAAETTAM